MSADKPKCHRCGDQGETHDWERDSTFWGWLGFGTETLRKNMVRIKSRYYRRNPQYGSPMLISDELQPLCDECWGDLVGLFLQGRAVPALVDRKPRA